MKKVRAAITGVHGYVPEYILTNEELTTMVDTSDEWIVTRTGIKERRILKDPGKASSDLAVKAINGLLEKTNTRASDIDLVLVATVTPDMQFPDTANIIRDKVGITKGFGFDINAACTGFIYTLSVAAKLIETGVARKAIVVGTEKMSTIVDYTDRNTCIIFGDGAGAVLLEPNYDDFGIMDEFLRSDGYGRQFLNMEGGGSLNPASHETVDARQHYVYQDGRQVFKFAVTGMQEAVTEIMLRNKLLTQDVKWLVPHQANIRIIQSTAEKAGFPMDKVMLNIERYGNTTAATIPLCLWDYEDQLVKGDQLILVAFGGGFTWGSILIKWAY
ncbi:MAG TPA: 3-oxoacyl-ACP synthase [Saprospirales bacterium]|nr:3-oxoacyl-ACP synthase [Saprospirales bacterium]